MTDRDPVEDILLCHGEGVEESDCRCCAVFDPENCDAYRLIRRLTALEQENAQLREALSGRTVSCSACNAAAEENARLREGLRDASGFLDEGDGDAARFRLRTLLGGDGE